MTCLSTHVRAAAAIIGLLASVAASASAIFASEVWSTFTVVTPGDAAITNIKENLPSSPTSGNGSVEFAILSAADVQPVTVHSKVSGSASAPPTSLSIAAAQRGHLVEIDRSIPPPDGLPTITVDFTFDMSWTVGLSVGMPVLESASGGAYFALSGFEDGIESFTVAGAPASEFVTDPDGKKRWEFNPSYFTDVAPVAAVSSRTVRGTITVFSGEVGAFSVITDSAGRADARAIPVPGTWLLLAGVLPVLYLSRRGRRCGASPPSPARLGYSATKTRSNSTRAAPRTGSR